jgi:hypothetical protein
MAQIQNTQWIQHHPLRPRSLRLPISDPVDSDRLTSHEMISPTVLPMKVLRTHHERWLVFTNLACSHPIFTLSLTLDARCGLSSTYHVITSCRHLLVSMTQIYELIDTMPVMTQIQINTSEYNAEFIMMTNRPIITPTSKNHSRLLMWTIQYHLYKYDPSWASSPILLVKGLDLYQPGYI